MTKRFLALLLITALFVAACGGGATPTSTPRPPTDVPPTEEATEVALEATEEVATEEAAPTEVAMAEVTEEATEEVATEEAEPTEAVMEATEEATEEGIGGGVAEVTEEATEEVATEVPTEVPPTDVPATEVPPTEVPTEVPPTDVPATEVAMAEVTEEATEVVMEATEEATLEPTPEPTEEATAEATEAPTGDLIPVSLQLQWVAQSQFCGYYAAEAQGFYEAAGLDVTILEGAVDIVPQQVVASGAAQFGIAWVPKVLESRANGADLVNIAQVFQRSGTLEVSFKDKGIESVEDLRGQRVGTWGFGNEHELFAALRLAGIDPNNPEDVTIVQQPFDMSLLLNDEVDAAEAMTYNEYAQVLEATDADGNLIYTADDLNVIDFNEVGTAMLQDHIFTSEAYLEGETNGTPNTEIATSFIKASLQGWIFCRDNFDEAVDIVLANGPTLGRGHMTWMLNEINKLVWPSPAGIGILDAALWEQTVNVAIEGAVISEAPSEGAFRTDLAQAAVDELTADGVDVTGESYEPQTVEITPGGE